MVKKSKPSHSNEVPVAASIDKQDRWRARDALSTLSRAEEIKRDKPLMREVKAEAKQQVKALGSVIAPKSRKAKTNG